MDGSLRRSEGNMKDRYEEAEDILKLLADFDREHPGFLKDFWEAIKKDPVKVIGDIHDAANMMELD
jgi:hypothetical protein